MAKTLRETMIEDMDRMEDAANDLAMDHRISIFKIQYWSCVAIIHIIDWLLRHEKK